MRLASRIAVGVIVALVHVVPMGAWIWWSWGAYGVDPRTRLDGVPVGAHADRIQTLVQDRTREKLARTITLEWEGGETVVALEEIGFVPEVTATLEALERSSASRRRCDPVACWSGWSELRAGDVDVTIVLGVDPVVLEEYLLDLKDEVDRPPVEARIDFSTGEVTDHVDGLALEVYTAAASIEHAVLVEGADVVELPVVDVEPRLTAATLADLDMEVVIGSFSTTYPYRGKNASRAFNVEHGASRLDGTLVFPRETVSFNTIVGERSLEAGFKEAPEIYEGEMVEGVGGGMCQVSSTLHAASVYAGLEVVERYPHSRPSSYIRMGLDATVSYPTVDLRIRNPYPFPVVVVATAGEGRIEVQIKGPMKPVEVEFHTAIVAKFPFEEEVEITGDVAPGIVYVMQYGLPGYLVRRVRTLEFEDGTKRVERTKDYYPPTKHIVRVSPETGYSGLTDAERGVEAEEADEGVLAGEDLEERPADFAAPEVADGTVEDPSWTIVNGPFAHPPKKKKNKKKKEEKP